MKRLRNGLICIITAAVFALLAIFAAPDTEAASALVASDIALPADEYEIGSAEDFEALASYSADNSTIGKKFVMTGNVTLSSSLSVGSSTNPFNGIFDAKGHVLTIAVSASDYSAPFGYVGSYGEIKNLTVKGVATGDEYVGGIAGYNSGVISRSVSEASVSGVAHTGGVVGYNAGEIIDCINGGTVSGTDSFTGGIAGENIGKIRSCLNVGEVRAKNYAGGIVGKSSGKNGLIFACVNAGGVVCPDNVKFVGGIVGETSATVSDCYNYASITASGISIGSAIGCLTSTDSLSGRVYNVGERSIRSVVGDSNVTVPAGFSTATEYDMLSGKNLFSEASLVKRVFDVGYGYFDCPSFVVEEQNAKYAEKLKRKLFSDGTGSEEEPFVIASDEDWNLFWQNASLYDYAGVYVRLGVSVVKQNVLPLGKTESGVVAFNGCFDGNFHKVTYSCQDTTRAGLFDTIGASGTVKNIVAECDVQGSLAGGIACVNYGAVLSSSVTGTVTGDVYVGGITAKTLDGGIIADCENSSVIRGNSFVGGIAGSVVNASIKNCVNAGKVSAGTADTYNRLGGIAGEIKGAVEVKNLLNKGVVSAYKAIAVGGIFGYAENVEIDVCHVSADVTGRRAVGGIVGDALSATVSACGITAKISGASFVAGICGRGTITIKTSYFNGTFGTVNEAAIETETFRTVAQSGSAVASDVYYNSDLITDGTDGTGASYVDLTNGIFPADSSFTCPEASLTYGILPIIKFDKAYGDSELVAALRYDYFDGGQGTADNPFVIGSEQQYRNAAFLINIRYGYDGLSYAIGKEINFLLNAPVIGDTNGFSGGFDGRNYPLSGVCFDGAMFGELKNGAIVRGIALESGSATTASISPKVNSEATVTSSYSKLVLSGGDSGGIVGENAGTVTECVFAGRITGAKVGGIAVINSGRIADCAVNGYLEGTLVGGVSAENSGEAVGITVNGGINGLGGAAAAGGFFGLLRGSTDMKLKDGFFIGRILLDGNDNVTSETAFLAGSITGAVPTVGFLFDKDTTGISIAYYLDGAPVDGSFYGRTTSEFLSDEFVNNFTQTDFVPYKTGSADSDYAPVNRKLTEISDGMSFLAVSASAIRLFGRNYLSAAEWGSGDNPYLIESAEQLAVLSDRTKNYDYSGKYFSLVDNLDFSGIDFRPIGQYVGVANVENRSFNGVIDGNYHKISNINVVSSLSYVGIFGYTGREFSLKNLFLDDTCSFASTGDYLGSVAGSNRGVINGVISYASVSGNGSVGGIVGYCENNTVVADTVFAGTITSAAGTAYGLIGHRANTVNVDMSGSKYLLKGDGFVVAGRESYSHNDYGDVIFVDRNGSAAVAFDGGSTVFTFAPEVGAKTEIMTAQDLRICSGNILTLVDIKNTSGVSMKYYARFTYRVRIVFATGSEENIASSDLTEGYYYQGQKAVFVFSPKYGYYIVDNPFYTDVIFGNDGEKITMEYVLSAASERDIPVELASVFDKYEIKLSEDNPVYDGTEKEFTSNTSDDIFEPFVYLIYDVDGNVKQSVKDAGDYVIKIRLVKKGETAFCGTAKIGASVAKKTVSIAGDNEFWSEYASKEYDGKDTLVGKRIDLSVTTGILVADQNAVEISAKIVWDGTDAGDRAATVSDFVVNGSENYKAEQRTITVNSCTISRREVIVSVPQDNLKGVYDGNRPVITGAILSYSVGDADMEWSFALLDENGNEDSSWQALPSGSKSWNVGRYSVTPTVNSANYTLVCDDYVFVIVSREIKRLVYSGYERLVYNGESQNGAINGVYTTVNGGKNYVKFNFYDGNGEETDVVHAGRYRAVPIVDDKNYTLGESVAALEFFVAKATPEKIIFSLDSYEVKVGGKLAITLDSEINDAVLSIEKDESSGDSRGAATVTTDETGIYFVPTKYPSGENFYFRLKSSGSADYEDGYSDLVSVKVTAGTVYVGLDVGCRERYFGDVEEISLIYTFDYEQTNIVDVREISAFVPPEASVGQIDGTGTYEVSFFGGSSDGYKIAVSANNVITVKKKSVRITIPDDIKNEKTYGDKDEGILYEIIDGTTSEKLDRLPDGTPVVLQGKLSRESGENVGYYAIDVGTLTAENNKNYDISYGLEGRSFEIKPRHLELVADAATKQYGQSDPKFTFSIKEGFSLAEWDDKSVLRVEIKRTAGETVGAYSYIRGDYNDGQNYVIDRIDVESNRFFIVRAVPEVVCYAEAFTLRYGDALGKVSLLGAARYGSSPVNGVLEWEDSQQIVSNVGEASFGYVFRPADNGNFAEVRGTVVVNVMPRIAEIAFGGAESYVYNGRIQGTDIEATVINAVAGDSFDIEYSYDDINSTDAGVYAVYVVGLGNDRYVLGENGIKKEYAIQPAVVTVTTTGGRIKEGEAFVSAIKYEGFVNGENESVLSKKAVADVPTEAGIHTVTARGAESKNYRFVYVGAELIIERTNISVENVTMKGDVGVYLDFNVVKSEKTALENNEKAMNTALGYNALFPNSKKIKEYYELRYNGKIDGEFAYSIKLNLSDGDKIYVKTYDGQVKELTDFDISGKNGETVKGIKAAGDGTVITFTSEQISAIAVYESKTLQETVVGFVPLVAIVAVALVIVVIIAVAVYLRRKRFADERKYLSRY